MVKLVKHKPEEKPGVTDHRQYGAGFDFEGAEAGVFYQGGEPSSDGIVEYMPVRSSAHLEMHRAIKASGVAHCTFSATDGRRLSFDVLASPDYGLLTVANFALR
jgi:hypothetical protein